MRKFNLWLHIEAELAIFRADAEVLNSKPVRNEHLTKCAAIGLGGFVMSVFFITWALVVLVRFYVFDSIFYNLFLVCMLTTGKFSTIL